MPHDQEEALEVADRVVVMNQGRVEQIGSPEEISERPATPFVIQFIGNVNGTVAVDIDPLSLLCRLATSVPPPRLHTVRYAGVLAAASPWRPRVAPKPPTEEPAAAIAEPDRGGRPGRRHRRDQGASDGRGRTYRL